MKNSIMYRPHQRDIYFALGMLVAGIFSFIALWHCILPFVAISYLYASLGILSVWLAKKLFDSSQIKIVFEIEGVRITDSKNNNRFLTWNKFVYAYFERNYKGHLFLVLSPQVLRPQQTKSLVNRAANTSRILVDDVCVIYLNNSQTSLQIEELIKQTALHIGVFQV